MTTPNPASPLRPRLRRATLAAVLLAGTALGGFAVGETSRAATVEETQGQAVNPTNTAAQHMPDFADLVAKAKPGVVSITTKMRVEEGGPVFPGFPFGPMVPDHPVQVEARGSGFIIDPDGTIVTNNHVVQARTRSPSPSMTARELPAKVVGTRSAHRPGGAEGRCRANRCPSSSSAIRAAAARRVGDRDRQPVRARRHVTAGIVSALGRDIGAGPTTSSSRSTPPINQGNSGGPLFTQDGKVVGVNTAILSPSGGSIGIGFAIPSQPVKNVVASSRRAAT